jgi:hypothetical protein
VTSWFAVIPLLKALCYTQEDFMTNRKIEVLFGLISVFSVLGSSAWAGTGSSGGSDLIDPQDRSAWFVNGAQRKIRICYEVSPDFSAPSSIQLDQELTHALQAWKEYAFTKEAVWVDNNQKPGFNPEISFDPIIRNAPVGGCSDGDTDLTVYFGVENPRVTQVLAVHTRPVAFAMRTDYSVDNGWGKGFVWFAAKPEGRAWPDEAALYGEVLHELGHVCGNDHASGTIMDENIAHLLFADMRPKLSTEDRIFQLTHIDQDHELVVADGWHYTYSGAIRGNSVPTGLTDAQAEGVHKDAEAVLEETFARIMGRKASGKVEVQLDGGGDNGFKLQFSDDLGKATFQVPYRPSQVFFETSTRAFYRVVHPVIYGNQGDDVTAELSQTNDVYSTATQPISFSSTLKSVGASDNDFLATAAWNGNGNSVLTDSNDRAATGFAPIRVILFDLKAEANGDHILYFKPVRQF